MKYQQHKESIEQQAKSMGLEMTSLGNPLAPLMIVGWQMYHGEKVPFTDRRSMAAVNTMQGLGVPREAVYLTNLVRLPPTENVIIAEQVVAESWVEYLLNEIKEKRPRAVILMGLSAARRVLMINDESLQTVRQRRFIWPKRFVGTSFFVTHDPIVREHVADIGAISPMPGIEFVCDIKAVVETDAEYFSSIRPAGGFNAEGS